MKFGTTKEVLLKGIQVVQNAINPKSSLPILSNILIDSSGDKVVITATDLDIGITVALPIKPSIMGSITIPAKKFFDITKELPDGDLTISVKKNNLVNIESQNCVFKIMGLPKDEFPQIPEFKDRDSISIQQKKLKEMINMTSFAVSHDETRYVLNGILFTIKPSHIRMVATDGRRLTLIEHKAQFPKTQERKFIVPTKAISELNRILKDENDVKISFGENQVSFDMGDSKMVSRLIEGEFPNYEQVIPKESKEKVRMTRQAFLSGMKRIALFTNPDSLAVKIELGRDKMVLSKNSPYLGEAHEEIGVEYKGKEMAIGFNPDYIIDVLKNIDQEMVNFEMADPEKPGVIRIGDEYIYVVLPMQLT
ncbi:MAG: DNA polymerase III subunit beta [Candidatus Omnitrophica bacterium]|nr:DNA polymerase III subunit beta [Candidatus Omnitrophota bacterium]